MGVGGRRGVRAEAEVVGNCEGGRKMHSRVTVRTPTRPESVRRSSQQGSGPSAFSGELLRLTQHVSASRSIASDQRAWLRDTLNCSIARHLRRPTSIEPRSIQQQVATQTTVSRSVSFFATPTGAHPQSQQARFCGWLSFVAELSYL